MFGSPPQVMMDDVIERIFSINNPKNSLLLPSRHQKNVFNAARVRWLLLLRHSVLDLVLL